MIKINLLQARKEKKKVGIRKEFIIVILSIALLCIILLVVQWKLNKEKEDTLVKISNTKKEITYYKSLTTEVDKAKAAQKTLQDKLNVINALRKEKGGPARVLDEISIDKPEKIHLESLKKEGSKLGIEGIALDDETVANFMTNLRKSKLFKNVDLIVSEQTELSKIKLKKFILSCEIILM
ncbi:MAG: PilN domain-containing protein [Thermodesulfobacteriota bacterium]